MAVVCQFCSKNYANQGSLTRHLAEKHNVQKNVLSYDIFVYGFKCLEHECNSSFKVNKNLIEHLKTKHNVDMREEVLQFDNYEGFCQWLNQIHNNENMEYIQHRGAKNKEDCEILYFNCSRSGKSRQVNTVRKRLKKSSGQTKMGYGCTSYIKVVKKQNKCTAFYNITHYGHDLEIQHLRIPKNEKANIARNLVNGVPITRILDNNRDNFCEDTIKRINLLTRKDVHNIKESFNIQIQEGVRHSEDATSVALFVEECGKMENNPILLYKSQGEEYPELKLDDFVIIIMNTSQQDMLRRFSENVIAVDSTHGLNSYDFLLTTVLVIDDWGEGFPGACLLSNREDTLIYKIFFEQIKNKVGCIKTKTFMTDITNVFYKAWVEVMGPVPNQIFCAWHIDRAWQSNLNKIPDLEKRKVMYHSLKTLQTTVCESDFHGLLVNLINVMATDEALCCFEQYFRENYLQNYKKWAYCYRKNLGINTNMRLESMHKTLKYLYLDGKKVKRLDKGLFALNKFIRDKVVDRIIKRIKGKNNCHIKDINERHRGAQNKDSFKINNLSTNTWQVISGKELYEVKCLVTSPCCSLRCDLCGICVHSFTCTCIDYFIHATICKHIHYVVLNSTNNILNESNNYDNIKSIDEQEIGTHLSTLAQSNKGVGSSSSNNKNKILENIYSETEKLNKQVVTSNDLQVLNHVVSTLKKENMLIEKTQKEHAFASSSKNEPSNKKIAKQLTFCSTKKKRKLSKKQLQGPTISERNVILNKIEFISNSVNNDHDYL